MGSSWYRHSRIQEREGEREGGGGGITGERGRERERGGRDLEFKQIVAK